MTEFLDDTRRHSQPDPKYFGKWQRHASQFFNLEKIKDTPIEHLDKEDKVALSHSSLCSWSSFNHIWAHRISQLPRSLNRRSWQLKWPLFYGSQLTNGWLKRRTSEVMRRGWCAQTAWAWCQRNSCRGRCYALNSILNNINDPKTPKPIIYQCSNQK